MTPWTSPFQATSFGACCPQPGYVAGAPGAPAQPLTYAEDCLHLNIWAPQNAKDLPVLIYIHGGGFVYGCGSLEQYNGKYFAESENTIIVTINYRLGAFGFLAGRGLKGNFGIKDQQLAFMWIQKNIGQFGGDPSKVTIDGQSAGAISVATHLSLASSKQLQPFRAAIIQSNPVLMQFRKLAEQDAQFDSVSSGAGCGFASDRLACLKQVSAPTLLASQDWGTIPLLLNYTWQSVIHKIPWIPTIDGDFLTQNPSTAFQTGNFYHVPVMIGTVANETSGFLPLVFGQGPSSPYLLATLYGSGLDTLFGSALAKKVRAVYPNTMPNSEDAMSRLLTDFAFTCSVLQSASWMSRYSNVYVYQMTHAPSCDPDNFLWKACKGRVCHSAELDFVFHSISSDRRGNCAWTPAETNLSWQMLYYWTNFTGNPTKFNALPRYNDAGTVTKFDTPNVHFSQSVAQEAHCDFWAKIVAGTA